MARPPFPNLRIRKKVDDDRRSDIGQLAEEKISLPRVGGPEFVGEGECPSFGVGPESGIRVSGEVLHWVFWRDLERRVPKEGDAKMELRQFARQKLVVASPRAIGQNFRNNIFKRFIFSCERH